MQYYKQSIVWTGVHISCTITTENDKDLQKKWIKYRYDFGRWRKVLFKFSTACKLRSIAAIADTDRADVL